MLDAILGSLAASIRPAEGTTAPVAILWTDADGQWRPVIPKLRMLLPELHTLGEYEPRSQIGPAIWLKCVVDRTIPEIAPAAEKVPILYLPGVSRQELLAGTDCPPAYQPLVELQYRGRVWHQKNGRDWTVEAFLVSDEGLGLDVAQDNRTRQAMLRSLPLLTETPIEGLRGRRLESDDFDKLAVSDPVRDLLRWLSAPEAFEKGLDGALWESFRSVCRHEFQLDPEEDGPAAAAAALSDGGGRWDDVWQRFREAPRLYPGVSALLREPRAGQGELAFDPSRSPAANDDAERRLRQALEKACSAPHRDACEQILALEREHGARRVWVWAKLGESPLAIALEPLARLASFAKSPLGGESLELMAGVYASKDWECDAAVLTALASVRGAAESELVARVIRVLYEPWIDATTHHFQSLVTARKGKLGSREEKLQPDKETCVLFADGLRYDVGQMLRQKLEGRDFVVSWTHRLAAFPTVTATAKPVAAPLLPPLDGGAGAEDFVPQLKDGEKPFTTAVLREYLADSGVAVLAADENGSPGATKRGAWTEIGRLDELGHKLGCGLAQQVEAQLDLIADRIVSLLEVGWRRVRVVTDHGWLLLPGDLPKVELAPYLVETKWARCAAVRGESTPNTPTYSWHWNRDVRIASPPGIACFRAGNEYAHGGVSLQECVVPELVVERSAGGIHAKITNVQWRGMRCRVSVDTNEPSVRVDLRLSWKQASSSVVASVKEVGPAGQVSLAVEDDTHEGASASLVVLDPAGNALDRQPTTVGEDF